MELVEIGVQIQGYMGLWVGPWAVEANVHLNHAILTRVVIGNLPSDLLHLLRFAESIRELLYRWIVLELVFAFAFTPIA